MAIAQNGTAAGNASAGSADTVTVSGITVAAGSDLALLSAYGTRGNGTTFTDATWDPPGANEGLTKLSETQLPGSNGGFAGIAYLLNPTVATSKTLVYNFGDSNRVGAGGQPYEGVAQTSTFGTADGDTANTGTSVSTTVTSETGGMCFSSLSMGSDDLTVTPGDDAASRRLWHVTAQTNHRHSAADAVGAASVTISWSWSQSEEVAAHTVPIAPAAAGGGTHPVNPFGHPLLGPFGGPVG